MENLNAEKLKKALECCLANDIYDSKCGECQYKSTGADCMDCMLRDALALINSQEQRIKELTEENERLRGILLQFTDIVHKWGNKNGYDTSEISLVPVIYEANTIKSQIVDDTVRKMQEMLKKKCINHSWGGSYVPDYMIDQIAKELTERENL